MPTTAGGQDRPLHIGDVINLSPTFDDHLHNATPHVLFGDGVVDARLGTREATTLDEVTECLFRVCVQQDYTAQKALSKAGASITAEERLQLERKQAAEASQNEEALADKMGAPVVYGQVVQLQHVKSGAFLSIHVRPAGLQRDCLRAVLSTGSDHSWLRIDPRFSYCAPGSTIWPGHQIVLRPERKLQNSLHMAPPNMPTFETRLGQTSTEVNFADFETGGYTGWAVCVYAPVVVPGAERKLRVGDTVRMFHSQSGGFVSCSTNKRKRGARAHVAVAESAFDVQSGARSLWRIEGEQRLQGGDVVLGGSYRLRHLATQQLLALDRTTEPRMDDQGEQVRPLVLAPEELAEESAVTVQFLPSSVTAELGQSVAATDAVLHIRMPSDLDDGGDLYLRQWGDVYWAGANVDRSTGVSQSSDMGLVMAPTPSVEHSVRFVGVSQDEVDELNLIQSVSACLETYPTTLDALYRTALAEDGVLNPEDLSVFEDVVKMATRWVTANPLRRRQRQRLMGDLKLVDVVFWLLLASQQAGIRMDDLLARRELRPALDMQKAVYQLLLTTFHVKGTTPSRRNQRYIAGRVLHEARSCLCPTPPDGSLEQFLLGTDRHGDVCKGTPWMQWLVHRLPFRLGAGRVLTKLISDNEEMVKTVVNADLMGAFLGSIAWQGPIATNLKFLAASVVCCGRGVERNQCALMDMLLDEQGRLQTPLLLSTTIDAQRRLCVGWTPADCYGVGQNGALFHAPSELGIPEADAVVSPQAEAESKEPELVTRIRDAVLALQRGGDATADAGVLLTDEHNQVTAASVGAALTRLGVAASEAELDALLRQHPVLSDLATAVGRPHTAPCSVPVAALCAAAQHSAQAQTLLDYYVEQITLFAALCHDRNYQAIHALGADEHFPYELLFDALRDDDLHSDLRVAFGELLLAAYIDREPYNVIPAPDTLLIDGEPALREREGFDELLQWSLDRLRSPKADGALITLLLVQIVRALLDRGFCGVALRDGSLAATMVHVLQGHRILVTYTEPTMVEAEQLKTISYRTEAVCVLLRVLDVAAGLRLRAMRDAVARNAGDVESSSSLVGAEAELAARLDSLGGFSLVELSGLCLSLCQSEGYAFGLINKALDLLFKLHGRHEHAVAACADSLVLRDAARVSTLRDQLERLGFLVESMSEWGGDASSSVLFDEARASIRALGELVASEAAVSREYEARNMVGAVSLSSKQMVQPAEVAEAQHLLRSLGMHEVFLRLLRRVPTSGEEVEAERLHALKAECNKTLGAFVAGNLRNQTVMYEHIDLFMGMLGASMHVTKLLRLILEGNRELSLQVPREIFEKLVAVIARKGPAGGYMTILRSVCVVNGEALEANQSRLLKAISLPQFRWGTAAVADPAWGARLEALVGTYARLAALVVPAQERQEVTLPMVHDVVRAHSRGLAQLPYGGARLSDAAQATTAADEDMCELTYYVALLRLLAGITAGKNAVVEAKAQSVLPLQRIVGLLQAQHLSRCVELESALLGFVHHAHLDTQVKHPIAEISSQELEMFKAVAHQVAAAARRLPPRSVFLAEAVAPCWRALDEFVQDGSSAAAVPSMQQLSLSEYMAALEVAPLLPAPVRPQPPDDNLRADSQRLARFGTGLRARRSSSGGSQALVAMTAEGMPNTVVDQPTNKVTARAVFQKWLAHVSAQVTRAPKELRIDALEVVTLFQERMPEQTPMLLQLGAAELVVTMLSAQAGMACDTAALRLGVALLNNGYEPTQRAFVRQLRRARAHRCFEALNTLLVAAAQRVKVLRRRFKLTGGGGDEQEAHGDGIELVPRSTADTGQEMDALVLRFLQLLCEGHNAESQALLSAQKNSHASFNLLSSVVLLLRSLAKSRRRLERYARAREVRLLRSVLDLIVEAMQGPCLENQATIASNSFTVEAVENILATDFGGVDGERGLKGTAVKLLCAMLEGRTDDVAHRLLAEKFDLNVVRQRLQTIFVAYEFGGADSSTLLEGFDLLTLVSSLRSRFPEVQTAVQSELAHGQPDSRFHRVMGLLAPFVDSPKQQRLEEVADGDIERVLRLVLAEADAKGRLGLPAVDGLGYKAACQTVHDALLYAQAYWFFVSRVRSIEVVWNGELFRLYFQQPKLCHYFTPKMQEDLLNDISIDSPEAQAKDLVARSQAMYEVLLQEEKLAASPMLRVVGEHYETLKKASFALAALMNLVLLLTLSKDNSYSGDVQSDPDNLSWLAVVCGVLQLMSSGAVLGYLLVKRAPMVTRTLSRTRLAPGEWAPAHPLDFVAWALRGHAVGMAKVVVMLLVAWLVSTTTPGLETAAFAVAGALAVPVLVGDSRALCEGASAALPFQFTVVYDVVFGHPEVLYRIVYVVMALTGLLVTPFAYAFHLLEVVVMSETLRNVVRAVTEPARQLAMTALLALILLYVFAVVAFALFPGDFKSDDDVFTSSMCSTLYSCALTHIHVGLLSGGGVGELLSYEFGHLPHLNFEDDSEYYTRVVFDLAFFIVVIVCVMNIVFGIIIDTFGQLREEQSLRERNRTEACMLCGIPAAKFQERFKWHITHEHSVFDIVAFVIHLTITDDTEFDGVESYVQQCIDDEDVGWMPQGQALSLTESSRAAQSDAEEQRALEEAARKQEIIDAVAAHVDAAVKPLAAHVEATVGPLEAKLDALLQMMST